ncbi:MAG TPA: hypothetical protein VFM18_18835 [Methanosarcina sp.]|nr:hypothetical protein [Methanosarcina sp.]
MSYYVVNKATGRRHAKVYYLSHSEYSERGAKIVCSKLNNKEGSEVYEIVEAEQYRVKYPVKMVERTNLLSGQKYMEAEDTPPCCSPASETYWSM